MSLRDGSAQRIARAATLKYVPQRRCSVSPSHNIRTLGQPVIALTLSCQSPGRVTTGVPVFKSLVRLPVEHRPTTTPGHRTMFWAALAIPVHWSLVATALLQCLASNCCGAGLSSSSPAGKRSTVKAGIRPRSATLEVDAAARGQRGQRWKG